MAKNKPRLVAPPPGIAGSGETVLPPARRPLLAGLVDQAGDPMLLIQPNGALLWANPVACARLGRTRDDLLSLPIGNLAHGFGNEALAKQLVCSNEPSSKPLEGEFVRADGSRWPVILQARKIVCDGEIAILVLANERQDQAAIRFAAETVLSQDLAGETALAAISSRLVQANNDDLDAPIRVSLAQLCQTLSADCGDLLLLNAANSAWTYSHHWSATPQLRFPPAEGPVPIGQLGWVWRQLLQLDAIMVRRVDGLPADAAADRQMLEAAGFASAVFAPLVHGGQILGCVVLGRTRSQTPWSDGDVALVRSVADLFATSIERQRMQIEMSGRLQFESLVGSIASGLLRTPANLLDPGIEQALQQIAEYLRADRAAVVLLSADGQRFGIAHEVCLSTSVPARETVQDLPVDSFLPRARRLNPADAAIIPDPHALPGFAVETRRILELFGIGSALAVPLVLGSEVVGGIVIGRSAPGQSWDEQQIALLRACADIIITTIQRLRIEQALRESDEKFSRTFLAMPDAVAITEIDSGRIIEANPAFETGLGLPLSEAIGRSAFELGFWGSMEEHQRLVDDVLRHGVVRNRELVIRRTTGGAVNLLLSAVRIELRGKPYLCTVMRDVTSAKAAEQALRTAESALRELNLQLEARVRSRTAELETSLRELESFSYSVSHDLRSPLRGINGFANLLAEDYGERLDENAREYLNRISSATVRMGNLIDELLDLARIARVPMRKTKLDLATVGRSIVNEFRNTEPMREIEVVIAPTLPTRADPGLIQIALSNLLGNAWKFTGATARPRIELGSRTVNGEQQFFVRDNGAGFDMTNSQLLFRPFSRLHRPTEFPGTGIGLATVARIVQRHGGRIWAEGQVGQGAGFYFTLG
jgi:PAS domain S-box-containing protein